MVSADFISGSRDYAKFNFRCADFDSFSGVHLTLGATVPEVFFSLGATELSGKAAKASREAARKPTSTTRFDHSYSTYYQNYALKLLTGGEREDLWYPG